MDVRTGAYRAVIRFFHLLLGPHLSALRFSIPNEFYTDLDISSIPALCPNIRMLDIAGFMSVWNVKIPEETVHLFSRAVSELSRMEIVGSSGPSWQLLSSLARAKKLRRLRVKLPHRLVPEPRLLSGDAFPQLRTLDIWADSLASCIDLFRWTSLNQVTEMSIRCLASYYNRDPLQGLVGMSSLISSQCQSLDFLWISCGLIRNRNDTPSSARWRPVLEPYQACHHLGIIALQVPCSLTLADNDLEDMVKAWPHLAVFHLFPGGKAVPPVHRTLRGITALLYHCLELKDFTLMFDATRVPECIAQPSCGKLVGSPSVKYMGVHTSPVSASSDIAAYLSIIMPSLKIIRLKQRAYEAAWSWICTRHPQKPTIHVDLPPMKLYYLLTAGTESSNEDIFGREWCWIRSSDAGRR